MSRYLKSEPISNKRNSADVLSREKGIFLRLNIRFDPLRPKYQNNTVLRNQLIKFIDQMLMRRNKQNPI